nr:MAG TPA: hypothetical protein [Caudoviricetes sp.]
MVSFYFVTPLGFKPKTFRTGSGIFIDCKYLFFRCL